jgi:hypothetical protein
VRQSGLYDIALQLVPQWGEISAPAARASASAADAAGAVFVAGHGDVPERTSPLADSPRAIQASLDTRIVVSSERSLRIEQPALRAQVGTLPGEHAPVSLSEALSYVDTSASAQSSRPTPPLVRGGHGRAGRSGVGDCGIRSVPHARCGAWVKN